MNSSTIILAILSLAFIACSDGEPAKSRGNTASQTQAVPPPPANEQVKFEMADGTVRDGAVQWNIWQAADLDGAPIVQSVMIFEVREADKIIHVKLSFLPRFIESDVDVHLEDVLGYAFLVNPRVRTDVGSVKYRLLPGAIIEGEVSAIFEEGDVSFEGARFRGTLLVDCIDRQDKKFCADSYNYALAGGNQ